MKKLLLLSTLLISIMLCCSACINAGADSRLGLQETSISHPNEEIKLGKYYLKDGDRTQYIEIKEGFGLELVGFDFYQDNYDLNVEYINSLKESGDTEQLQLVLDDFKATDELRNSSKYYQIEPLSGNVMPKTDPEFVSGGGWSLRHPDGNTLEYSADRIYILEE